MTFLIPLVTKLVWWLAPQIINRIIDYVETTLRAVEAAEQIDDYDARRLSVLQQIDGWLPDTAERLLVEVCVILYRLGVTADRLDTCQELVQSYGALDSAEGRMDVLRQLCLQFPDMPERAGRLLVEFCIAKVRASQ